MAEATTSGKPAPESKKSSTLHYGSFSLSGQEIDGFRFEKGLGEGAMSEVYRCTNLEERVLGGVKIKRFGDVVVKVLKPDKLKFPDIVSRFKTDGEATRQHLNHPNIVNTLHVGEGKLGESTVPYMVSQFIDSAIDMSNIRLDLNKKLSDQNYTPIPLEDIIRIFIKVGDALAHAHSTESEKKEVLHRDIKPGNIIFDPATKEPYLIDFGLGKIMGLENDKTRTEEGTLMGTPDYMSPEQADELKDAVASSDWYSLMLTMYYAVTGLRPRESKKDLLETRDIRSRVVNNRVHPHKSFEVLINEAISLQRDRLNEHKNSESCSEEVKALIDTELEYLVPLNPELADEIDAFIVAKDITSRPEPNQTMERVRSKLDKNEVRYKEPTKEEAQALEKERADLDEQIKEHQRNIQVATKKGDIKTQIEEKFNLAQTKERLSDLTPRTDDQRARYIREALEGYKAVQIDLKRNKNKFGDEGKRIVKKIGEIFTITAKKNHLEFKRMGNRNAANLQESISEKVKEGIRHLGSNDPDRREKAAELYRSIDPQQVPEESDQVYVLFTGELRSCFEKDIAAAESFITTSIDDAKEHFAGARTLSDVLHDAKIKEKSREFNKRLLEAEVTKMQADYLIESNKVRQLEYYNRLKECAEDPDLADGTKERIGKFLADNSDILECESTIGFFSRLQEDYKKLEQRIDEEQEISGEKGLHADSIARYTTRMQQMLKHLGAFEQEHIGEAPYSDFKMQLTQMIEDMEVSACASGLDKAEFPDKLARLQKLILHYHQRDDGTKEETRYLNRLRSEIDKREREIEKKD